MTVQLASLPDDPGTSANRRQRIVDLWKCLRVCGEPGATTWEVLDALEREVTECLALKTPDMDRAESITALAMLLIAGNESV
jgi:hypothetical protein